MGVRTTIPANDNKCYLMDDGGGYNKCRQGNGNNTYQGGINKRPTQYSVLPNCVGYCYGRWLEVNNLKSCNLPTCDAKNWYNEAKKRGFTVSKEPSVWSVAVFAGTTYGHVAFVERIEANGDIFLSESNWGHQIFRNVSVSKKSGYNYSGSLKLVGFIHNPQPPKAEAKKEEVKKTEDKKSDTKIVYKKTYTKGDYKVTGADVLNVRKGPGITYDCKKYKELTLSARTKNNKLTKSKPDGYAKGLTFSCKEVKTNGKDKYTWGKTASGWVALDFCTKI